MVTTHDGGVRQWWAVAGGAALIAVSGVAPLASGPVWAAVVVAADSRVVVAPALVLSPDGALPDTSLGVATAATPVSSDPAAPTSQPEPGTGAEAVTAPTASPGSSTSSGSSPQTVRPTRAHEIEDEDEDPAESESSKDSDRDDD